MLEAALATLVREAVVAAVAPLASEIADLRLALDARLPERWLTRTEAADALHCSVDTIDRQIASGVIRSQKIGRRGVRIRLALPSGDDEIERLAREARGHYQQSPPSRDPQLEAVKNSLYEMANKMNNEGKVAIWVNSADSKQARSVLSRSGLLKP